MLRRVFRGRVRERKYEIVDVGVRYLNGSGGNGDVCLSARPTGRDVIDARSEVLDLEFPGLGGLNSSARAARGASQGHVHAASTLHACCICRFRGGKASFDAVLLLPFQ